MVTSPAERQAAAMAEVRQAVREMILTTLREVPTGRWNATEIADAILDRFTISTERVSEVDEDFWMVMPGECEATHRRYVLRSAPQRVEEGR